MNFALFAALAAAGLAILLLMKRRAAKADGTAMDDAGTAIVAFGRAYPSLPIRDVVLTQGRGSAFLRLADGRVGFVQTTGRNVLARLLAPGSASATAGGDERTLIVDFREAPMPGGAFTFASPSDAAEVSLWLVEGLAMDHRGEAERTGGQGKD